MFGEKLARDWPDDLIAFSSRHTKPDIASIVVRMANENPTWGFTRIRGGPRHLGHDIARNTIKASLIDHGIEPAPERRTKTSWKTLPAEFSNLMRRISASLVRGQRMLTNLGIRYAQDPRVERQERPIVERQRRDGRLPPS